MRAIVFILRGCPAGWLGTYGNEWVGTPSLDQLAAESVVFDRHISDCPDPAAANEAWLQGSRLVEELRSAEVRTVLVRANHPDTDASAFYYAGWSEVFDARPQAEDALPLDNLIRSLPAVLDKLGDVPRWLVWVEIDRLLPPWDVPQDVFEAYVLDEGDAVEEAVEPCSNPPIGAFDSKDLAAWEWLHSSFAAVVTKLDAELDVVFDELRSRGLDQTAAWFVTSDFGYPLGEHAQVGIHRPWLHEELVHLPLLMRLPGAVEAGRRVAAFTQPADLAPTLLGLFGIADDVSSRSPLGRGYALLPLARGEVESVRDHAITALECNGVKEVAIRTDEWAYLQPVQENPDEPPRTPLLFIKPEDRWEVNDVLSQHAEAAEHLKSLLADQPGLHRP